MSNTHGGARPGAGRKPKAEKYAEQITAIEDRLADSLKKRVDTLEELAQGGFEKKTRKLIPAVLIMKKVVVMDALGVPHNIEEPAFPDEKPGKLICVEETRETLAPDRAAGIYLTDRILGKPTQAVEMSGPSGEAIEINAQAMAQAAKELAEWRTQMSEGLTGLLGGPPE